MTQLPSPGRVLEFRVGDRIRLVREDLGLERQEFAELIGVDRQTIGYYELGRHKPRLITLRAIAMAAGVDLEWLRTGVPSQPAPTPGGGHHLTLAEAPGIGVCSVSDR